MKRFALLFAVIGCADNSLDSTSQQTTCPATQAFAVSACICEDFDDIGNLVVGKSVEKDKATLAVMGATRVINNFQVRGDFRPQGGLTATGNLQVTGSLVTPSTVDDIGNIEVDGDLSIGGDLKGIGRLAVGGALSVAGSDTFFGYEEVASTSTYQAAPAPECGCTGPNVIDVAAAVTAAKSANDNAANGVPTSFTNIGAARLELTTGSYYMTDLAAIGATFVAIKGHVSLYLDGNLEHIGAAWMKLENGAMLDLYVSGSVRTIGHVDLGNKWDPSAFRLYIGGGEKATISIGNQLFNGAIYAPTADIEYIGNTQIRGAITAKSILGIGNLEIGYAAPECPQADP
ncbi:MAG: hypothetical protein H0V17_11280, partial [Deltaproteobacteria bacterium]|nr:hypothetical protein [Deltaproteobacteria bacterium]